MAHQQGVGLEVEQPGSKLVLMWGAGVTGRSLLILPQCSPLSLSFYITKFLFLVLPFAVNVLNPLWKDMCGIFKKVIENWH